MEHNLRAPIATPTLLLMHLAAGKSILTLRSSKSGQHMTLRFSRPSEENSRGDVRPIWVSLFGGPAGDFTNEGNERRNWKMVGTIWPNDDGVRFTHSRRSPLAPSDPAVRCAAWIAQHFKQPDALMEMAEWWHEGVCGRCGLRLTVPESIASGFGPDCIKLVTRELAGAEEVS